MENIRFGSQIEIGFFLKSILIEYSYEASNDMFYDFSEYGILLLSINKTCFEFETHLINKNRLLWNITSCPKDTLLKFNKSVMNEQKPFFLFVRSKNMKKIWFLGERRMDDVLDTEKRLAIAPYIFKGRILTLESIIDDNLWEDLGWGNRDIFIKELKLPDLYLLEYIEGKKFGRVKRTGENINYLYIYMMIDINNYLKHLFKIGREILNQNLVFDKFICLGEISSEEFVVLNYAKSDINPTIELFYSSHKIANTFEEFISKSSNNDSRIEYCY